MADSVLDSAPSIGVGLLFDMRNPDPWRQPAAEVYGRVLDRIQEAERLGLTSAWFSEHHFFDDDYLPQPLTLAAAAAARTSRMRIGTSILNGGLHNPVSIAEQAAIVDIISGGRLDLGIGSGYAEVESEAYGVDHSTRRGRVRALITALPDLWENKVTPRPVQDEIPLWLAAMGPQMARFAGRAGIGLLLSDDEIVEVYTAALPDPAQARCVDMTGFFLADDPERTWAQLAPHMAWIARSYSDLGANDESNTSLKIDVDTLRHREGIPPKPLIDVVTPEEAIRRLTPWATSRPLAHMQFTADFAGLPEDLIDRHVELLGRHIVGAFPSTAGSSS